MSICYGNPRYSSCVTIEKQGFPQRRFLKITSRPSYKSYATNSKLTRLRPRRVFHSSDLRHLCAKGLGALDLARFRCNGCMNHRDPAAVLMTARDVLETAGPGLSSSSRTGRDTPVQQSDLCVIRRAKDVSNGLLRPFRYQDEQVVLGARTGDIEQPGTGERTRIICQPSLDFCQNDDGSLQPFEAVDDLQAYLVCPLILSGPAQRDLLARAQAVRFGGCG